MGAQVADFPLHPVHKTLGGRLSGSVDLTVDRKARRVVLDGKAELAERNGEGLDVVALGAANEAPEVVGVVRVAHGGSSILRWNHRRAICLPYVGAFAIGGAFGRAKKIRGLRRRVAARP